MSQEIKAKVEASGYANLNEAMQVAKEQAGIQDLDLADFPFLQELFDEPTVETANKARDHYMAVLTRLEELNNTIKTRK